MTVIMTAAGMLRHVFLQSFGLKERNVFRNGSCPCLKYPHAGGIEFVQRPAADAADNNYIHLMTAKPRYRIAGTMQVDLVTVVD